MTQQIIGIGSAPNDGTGDNLRTAGGKINDNFTELYDSLGGSTKLDSLLTFLTKTTDYTLQASDKTIIDAGGNLMFVIDSASAVDFTVPIDATIDFPEGTQILIKTIGTGLVTFIPDGIVSITGSSGGLTSPGQYSLMALIKTETANTWYLENGSAAASPYDLVNTEVDTTGGTIILDFNSAFEAQFTSSDDIPSTRDVEMSNDTVAIRFVWLFNISALTPTLLQFPVDWIMNDPNFSSNAWTAPATGDYKMRGEFNGTDWIIDIDVAGTSVPDADATTKGIAKLYTATGSNTDGAMDQNSITTALALKLALAGGTMGGNIAMGSNKVTGLAAASGNGEAVRYEQLPAASSETVSGLIEIATQAEVTTGTDDVRAITPLKLATEIRGVQDLFISAAAMWPRTTGGCQALAQTEMATSLFNIQSLDFDQTTQEFAQFQISLPRKYNNGTVTVVVYWTAASGSGSVVWGVSGGAYSDGDALTVALGTAQTVTDTLLSANQVHVSSATSAMTLAGTPADADFLAFQVSRNPADGSDTLTADAKLLGISIRITVDSGNDA